MDGCREVKEEYEVQELENLEKVGTLAFNLMGSLMLTWATVFPHWTQISYPDKMVFSNLLETCVEGACWKPGDSAGYLIYGRCFIVFAVVFSFFLNLMLLGFFFQLCSPFPLQCLIFAIMDSITAITVFIGLLMHTLQMKSFKDKDPRITFLWPYFIVFICFILFLYPAILFILIYKEFFHTKCLRSSRVIPKDPNLEREQMNLEPMESIF